MIFSFKKDLAKLFIKEFLKVLACELAKTSVQEVYSKYKKKTNDEEKKQEK